MVISVIVLLLFSFQGDPSVINPSHLMWKRMKFLKGENCSLVTEKKSLSTSVLTGKTKESGFAMLHVETPF